MLSDRFRFDLSREFSCPLKTFVIFLHDHDISYEKDKVPKIFMEATKCK